MPEGKLLDWAREALGASLLAKGPPYRMLRDDARAVLEVGVEWLRAEGFDTAATSLEQAINEKKEVVE